MADWILVNDLAEQLSEAKASLRTAEVEDLVDEIRIAKASPPKRQIETDDGD